MAGLPKTTAEEARKLTEAATNIRANPGFAVIDAHLKKRLEETRDRLCTDQTTMVPNLQGRAQMLSEILELLHRKS